MTAPRIAIVSKAFIVGLSLCSVLGCVNIGTGEFIVTPTSYSLDGTTWAGPYNDSNGRGNGTLTIVFDRTRDSSGRSYGNWVTTFPDATRNISGPVQLDAHFRYLAASEVSMTLGTPHFNTSATDPGPGCYMILRAVVSGREMMGNINTGVHICAQVETQRKIAVTLSQQ